MPSSVYAKRSTQWSTSWRVFESKEKPMIQIGLFA